MATRRGIALSLVVIPGCILAASVLLAPVLFNLDRYRPEVISYFEENTGKKVEIGRLALTFFPQGNDSHRPLRGKKPSVIPPQLYR